MRFLLVFAWNFTNLTLALALRYHRIMRGSMGKVLWILLFLWVETFAATVSVVLLNGTVVEGQVESGLPVQLSMTLPSGDLVVLNTNDVKIIRFQRGGQAHEVENWASQIFQGTIMNLGSVITLVERGGATRSIPRTEIAYIRFLPAAPVTPSPGVNLAPGAPEPPATVVEAYKETEWAFFLGLGYSAAGFLQHNGFGYPRNEVGLNASLGVHWRLFFPPSLAEIELRLRNCGASTVEQARACLNIRQFLYMQVATDLLIYPSLGVGVWIPLGESAFLDFGVLLNLGLLAWWPYPFPYLGVGLLF